MPNWMHSILVIQPVVDSTEESKNILDKFYDENNPQKPDNDKKDIKVSEHPILDGLVGYALRYFEDIVKPNKKYRKPNEKEKKALQDLVKRLKDCLSLIHI